MRIHDGSPRSRGKARNRGKIWNWLTGWLADWLVGYPPPFSGPTRLKTSRAHDRATTAPEEIFRLARPSDGRNIASA